MELTPLDNIKIFFKRIPAVYYKIAAVIAALLLIFFIVVAIVILNKRDPLLISAIEKAKVKIAAEYEMDLLIDRAYFSGLKEVTFENVTIVPKGKEQLASVKRLKVSVKIFPLFSGKIKIANLNLEDASLTFIKKDNTSNYDFLFRERKASKEDAQKKKEPLNLAKIADRMIHQVLYKIPDNMKLRDFEVSYHDDSLHQSLTVPEADIDDGDLSSTILVNRNQATWYLTGKLHPGRNDLFFRLFAKEKKVEFPLLEEKYGIKLNFDTLEAHLKKVKWRNKEEFQINASGRIGNLLINHWRVASNDVVVPNASMDAEFIIGKESVELDKNSEAKVDKIILHPHVRYTLGPHKTYSLGLSIPELNAQDAFDSFPIGLFESLEGMKVSGKLAYNFSLFLDTSNPDSVKLRSSLKEQGFKVNSFGKQNFSKINSTFIYTPYENDSPVRDITVGPSNPNFTPLNEISPLLRNAVLTAEDPSFFSHEGFVEESIRASIATNFKEKAFKRGGSTISMQLVKNVFLDREKTLARKVEEMLIVWLIEHNRIVSKERMFEVYLNVIEWGNNIYGIAQASQHYFLKRPADLNLGESIFLASIVPNPKKGINRFNEYGGLRPFMTGYYRLIGTLMANSGYISRDSTRTYGFYSVSLRNAVLPQPVLADTTDQNDDGRDAIEREIEEAERLLRELFGTEN